MKTVNTYTTLDPRARGTSRACEPRFGFCVICAVAIFAAIVVMALV